MRYRVKQTDLTLSGDAQAALQPNADAVEFEAPNAMEAVAEFIRQKDLQKIGIIDEGTGGTASAICRLERGRFAIVRAFPV